MQGASTITQQYVRQALVETNAAGQQHRGSTRPRAKNLSRKLREARYALALEQKLTKDQILEDYLNTVYFGNGAYGISAAAQHYFSESVDDADVAAVSAARRRHQQPQHVRPDRSTRSMRRPAATSCSTGCWSTYPDSYTAAQIDAAKAAPLGLNRS